MHTAHMSVVGMCIKHYLYLNVILIRKPYKFCLGKWLGLLDLLTWANGCSQ